MYLPIKSGDDACVKSLFECLKDVKSWMDINFIQIECSWTLERLQITEDEYRVVRASALPLEHGSLSQACDRRVTIPSHHQRHETSHASTGADDTYIYYTHIHNS